MTIPFTSTMGVFTAGDTSEDPMDHSWWYAPLDFSGPAPADADSATRINNVNSWLSTYDAESLTFVEKWLYFPNGGNDIPIYWGKATDPIVDWGIGISTVLLHTPSNAPGPGSTGAGTRNGHLFIYDRYATPPLIMGTGFNGWSEQLFELDTKGIQHDQFDGSPGNSGPRGRSGWAKELTHKEWNTRSSYDHRIGMGWPDADKVDIDNPLVVGSGPNFLRTDDYAWPMTGNDKGAMYAVQGQVFRIKASVNLSSFQWVDPVAKALATTMQTYGAMVLDGAGPFTGGPLMDEYTRCDGQSQELVLNIPLTPSNWEWVEAGYDPRDGSIQPPG